MLDKGLLSINQVTTRDQWSLKEAVEGYSRQGIHGIGVWRDKMMEFGSPKNTRQLLKENGMSVSGFCIGGLITSFDKTTFQKGLDENRRIIEEAAIIESKALIFIAGGLPKDSKDITGARPRVLEGLSVLLPEAKKAGVTIAIEPLHPMLAANRSVLTTMKEANDWCDQLGTGKELGIAVDVYHVWWDPTLESEIKRAGSRIAAFHINDWLDNTKDLRLDRGMMGDGVIDIPKIRKWVKGAGFKGYREVEILSQDNWWKKPAEEVVKVIKERYQQFV